MALCVPPPCLGLRCILVFGRYVQMIFFTISFVFFYYFLCALEFPSIKILSFFSHYFQDDRLGVLQSFSSPVSFSPRPAGRGCEFSGQVKSRRFVSSVCARCVCFGAGAFFISYPDPSREKRPRGQELVIFTLLFHLLFSREPF